MAEPSPLQFFEMTWGFQKTAAIRAAVQLDLFTAIGGGSTDAASLAAKVGASEKGVRVLCDFLTVQGLLNKDGARYSLTLDSSVFLDKRSAAYIGSAVHFLTAPFMVEQFSHLTESVRRGGTAASEEGSMAPEHPMWVDFAEAMAPVMAPPAEAIARLIGAHAGHPARVLDVAAGHGMFGIAIARANPAAHIVAVDWAAVLKVAQANAKAAGVADRFETIPGSVFQEDLGQPYDYILLPNFLHHFGEDTIVGLLIRLGEYLKPHGAIVTFEFIPNDDRVTPPTSATFAMTMLGTTVAGDAYTFAEYRRMFEGAGFTRNELHSLPKIDNRVILSHR